MKDALLIPIIESILAKDSNSTIGLIVKDSEQAEDLLEAIKFYIPEEDVSVLPSFELLPYDNQPPALEHMSAINHCLDKIILGSGVFIFCAQSLMGRYQSPEVFLKSKSSLQLNQKITIKDIISDLNEKGYVSSSTVREYGTYCEKGNILDIYPLGGCKPVRLHIENSSISKIYSFSPATQRNIDPIKEFSLYPVYSVPFSSEERDQFCSNHWNTFGQIKDERYAKVKSGEMIDDALFFLPLFTDKTSNLLSYFPKGSKFFTHIDLEKERDSFKQLCEFRYDELSTTQNVLLPDTVFSYEELNEIEEEFQITYVDEEYVESYGGYVNGVIKQDKASATLLQVLAWNEKANKVLMCVNSEARERQLRILFSMKRKSLQKVENWSEFLDAEEGYYFAYSAIPSGFYDKNKNFVVISEREFFGTQSFTEIEYSVDGSELREGVLETVRGFPMTHATKGVGRFMGLVKPDVEGAEEREYVKLEYSKNSAVFVPIDKIDLLSEYRGLDPETVPLDDGKGKKWLNKVSDLENDVTEVAENLIRSKIAHHVQEREPYVKNVYEYNKFSSGFSFMLTQDQHAAINDIIADLVSTKVMDRLLVGDVGYGKSEVAMRACFIVTNNDRQCSVIAPTTLLAAQHYETFKARFEGTGKRIGLLTRKNKSEERKVLKELANGEIDIIIGTHRLLQNDIVIPNLGLLVIDEEHRFGVKQKQKITNMRVDLDVLALTATPIPRTLSSALHGVRDSSTIRTAPSKRLAIRTESHVFDDETIRVAIQRELLRNGQVFFLQNDIQSIEDMADHVRALVPDARVEFAHGKMSEVMLFELMARFRNHEFDVLVSTTIIETGIDIPNANTILINGAEKLGLAQMHQIRGRVGRGRRQAYAYLLTPEDGVSGIAEKRLKAMTENTNLGGGFHLSTVDMEIRGAGEILGEKQSGHINSLGYDLYFRMLEATIQRLERDPVFRTELLFEFSKSRIEQFIESEDQAESRAELDTNLQMDSSIPSSFIEDEAVRMYVYRKIIMAKTEKDVEELRLEISDRYGDIPQDAEEVFSFFKAKRSLPKHGIESVTRKAFVLNVRSRKEFTNMDEEKISKAVGNLGVVMQISKNEIQISQNRDAVRNIRLQDIAEGIVG
jgi:transcription-repair coupling factor (superfamily II helicase)